MVKKVVYSWKQFDNDVNKIIKYLKEIKIQIDGIFAIPKGGLVLGVALANRLNVPLYRSFVNVSDDTLIVDDISDTGETLSSILHIENYITITLFKKQGTKFIPKFSCRECKKDDWVVFPWEGTAKETKRDGTQIK